jgi:hypothetical protein
MAEAVTRLVEATRDSDIIKPSSKESSSEFLGSLTEVPKSSFYDNENDNDLPKSYIMVISWSGIKVEKPKVYESLDVGLPFDIPDVKKYVGPYQKPGREPVEDAQGTYLSSFN